MKKIFLAAVGVGFACVANASYLIWQVNPSDGSNVSGWNAAIVYQVQATDEQISAWNSDKVNPIEGATELAHNYKVGVQSATTGVIDTGTDYGSPVETMPAGMSAAAGELGGEGYAYYIELVHCDNSGAVDRVFGRSNAYSYAALAEAGSISTGLTYNLTSISAWHGSNSFTPVPEPTSGLMVLLGVAALGLRRRKRRLA